MEKKTAYINICIVCVAKCVSVPLIWCF